MVPWDCVPACTLATLKLLQLSFTRLIEFLHAVGAPVRQHLLSDLAEPGFATDSIKLAVFLNAWRVTPQVQAAIDSELKVSNKTLVFIYAAGIINDATGKADPAGIVSLTELPLQRGQGGPRSLRTVMAGDLKEQGDGAVITLGRYMYGITNDTGATATAPAALVWAQRPAHRASLHSGT
eukprot:SAG22_NODE_349_length_11854_cov_8.087282_10_plen_180_part_00